MGEGRGLRQAGKRKLRHSARRSREAKTAAYRLKGGGLREDHSL